MYINTLISAEKSIDFLFFFKKVMNGSVHMDFFSPLHILF